MPIDYIPMKGPEIVNKQIREYVNIEREEDPSILDDSHEEAEEDSTPGELIPEDDKASMLESLNYNPAIGDFSSPVSDAGRDITDMNKDHPGDDPLLDQEKAEKGKKNNLDLTPTEKEMVQYVPSDVVDYYNEAALTARARNELPDDAFGLPRLRAYPLHDEKHVRQAIRMFHNCRDPKDKATLAKNIFAKIEEYKMDVTIGKKNPLHEYAPKALQETVGVPILLESVDQPQSELSIPMDKRSKQQIMEEHLRTNSLMYNALFYGPDFAQSVKKFTQFYFFDYFYPNFKTHTLYGRLKTALGGMGMNQEVYSKLGIRYPLTTDFSQSLGVCHPAEVKDFDILVSTNYDVESNWIHADTSSDLNHVMYCLRLYSILGEIMNSPDFSMDKLTEFHTGILLDWKQQVLYHWDLMHEEIEYSPEYLKQVQYLYDLFWNVTDNPLSEEAICSNIVAMLFHMVSGSKLVDSMNEAGGELVSKTDTVAYMIKELGIDDDVFLLPDSLEYPVINKASVRMAMDCIRKIDPEKIPEYTKNLNRKYKELGCTFSITVDHPYAKYADQNIVDHMNRILMEGDTCVSDPGTSGVAVGGDIDPAEPWYKRTDVLGTLSGALESKELGPAKKAFGPDYTMHRDDDN